MVFLEECGQMKYTARTDTAGTLALSVGKFHFFRQEGMNAEAESKSGFPHFISVWPTKWWDGGGTGEWWVGGGGVIHSAETLRFNPIYSHPQQKIITTLKPARRGAERKGPTHPNCASGPWSLHLEKEMEGRGDSVSRTQVRHCDKIRVCVANEAKWFFFLFFPCVVPLDARWAVVEGAPRPTDVHHRCRGGVF